MDYQEEQKQELEILESIYPDELTIIKDEYPGIEMQIDVRLDLVPMNNSSFTSDSISNEHILQVTFSLPENYPDEIPEISIEVEEIPKFEIEEEEEEEETEEVEQEYDDYGNPLVSKLENLPDKIHFDEYIPELIERLNVQIEEDMLLGMQMCFSLLSNIKELAEEWFQNKLNTLEKEHERQLLERERQEQKKFQGTKVTKNSYLEWRSKFREELGLDERDAKRRLAAHQGRLTGRQIFEEGLAGDEDLNDDTALTENLEGLSV